jgi:ribosome biogenesis GTPase / thiamine phosphate phosphatase
MGKLTKRQIQRVKYAFLEKAHRQEKQKLLQEGGLPKFIERHLPYIRKLARNLDQLLIVTSFTNPPLKRGLIDRLLVLCEVENLKPVICLNKVDLLQDHSFADHLVDVYGKIGYEILATSAITGEGIEPLNALLRNKRSALAGHSGVGKSSLLNAIAPKLKLRVNEVSRSTKKGQHTTTTVKIYTLDKKTEVIDLPGVKLVGFIDIHRSEARFYFREFLNFAGQCKFRDCLHLAEIDCAVKAAVEQGEIDAKRYQSYCTFVDSLT